MTTTVKKYRNMALAFEKYGKGACEEAYKCWTAGQSVELISDHLKLTVAQVKAAIRAWEAHLEMSATGQQGTVELELFGGQWQGRGGNGDGDGYEELFRRFADAIQQYIDLDQTSCDRDEVERIVDERLERIKPKMIGVKTERSEVVLSGCAHTCFEDLMRIVNAGRKNIMLVGPAGTGKTTLARQLAEGLCLEFGFISLSIGVTETHLFGRILPQADGSWKYVKSKFVEIYEKGGVFLLDEIDGADPNVMVAINAALANGMFANPVSGDVVHRHEKCYIIGAANTWGYGGDAQYVGRNQLDAATLDRFVLAKVFVGYDTSLEGRLIREIGLPEEQAIELETFTSKIRKKINECCLRRVCSTRFVVHAAEFLVSSKENTMEDVKKMYFEDWSKDELARAGF